MEAEHLAEDGLHGGVLVFKDKLGDFLRQVGVLQHFGDEILVENGPRLGAGRQVCVEFFGQEMGDGLRAGAGLAGKSDERKTVCRAERSTVFLADQVSAVFREIIGVGHAAILPEPGRGERKEFLLAD